MTFGTDPEFVLWADRPISAITILPPLTQPLHVKGSTFYQDNVLAECTVPPGDIRSFVSNLQQTFSMFAKIVRPFRIEPISCVEFSPDQLRHPAALTLGCAPDNCAYKIRQIAPPRQMLETSMRSCGGHLHLGHPTLLLDGPEPIFAVYMLDLILGTSSIVLDKNPHAASRRRFYGQAGRFRSKPNYGLEYRTLSNFWLKSPVLVNLICELAILAVEIVTSGQIEEFWDFHEDTFFESDDQSSAFNCKAYDAKHLQDGINTANIHLLDEHVVILNRLLPVELREEIDELSKVTFKSFYEEWDV